MRGFPPPPTLPWGLNQGGRGLESDLLTIINSFLRHSFSDIFLDAFWKPFFRHLEANLAPKTPDFEGPSTRNSRKFAKATWISAIYPKSAPLPYENHIFTYFRYSKNYRKSFDIPSKTLQKSTSSWNCVWNPKNHDFYVKNIDV